MKKTEIVNPKDIIYTRKHVVENCLDIMDDVCPEWRVMDVVDPSAGEGVFFNAIRDRGVLPVGMDIETGNPDIWRRSFLTYDAPLVSKSGKGLCIVGNPPFGNSLSMSLKFVNHSVSLKASVIAFILPVGFLNPARINKIHDTHHRVHISNVREGSYVFKGRVKSVPSIFCIFLAGKGGKIDPTPCKDLINVISCSCVNLNGYKKGDLCLIGTYRDSTVPPVMISRSKNIFTAQTLKGRVMKYRTMFIRVHSHVSAQEREHVEKLLLGIDWKSQAITSAGGHINQNAYTVHRALAKSLNRTVDEVL